MKKKLLILVPVIIFIGVYMLLFNSSYKPTDNALALANQAVETDNYLTFENSESNIGIIIYPGGKVNYEAYAPLATTLSENYDVYLIEMPLDLAIFGNDRADDVIADNSEIKEWYIVGHSLGGVMAAQYAHENQDVIKGLVLLASYPQDAHDFSNTDTKVLTILGSLDGLVENETFEESKKLLPEDAEIVIISGGNHAQMGDYGKQKKDLDATISREEQERQVIESIIKWIN